jgi:peptidoglycan-associated lipoprotein
MTTAPIVLAALTLLVACSSKPVAPARPEEKMAAIIPPKPVPDPIPNRAIAAPASRVTAVIVPPYLDSASQISTKRSIFFDYDIFTIKSDFVPVLEMHGKYLAANPKISIRVEGNADERGSKEYNLALGQKRAEATSQALVVYGVKTSQMEAVSWGEEKPKATAHDEAAYAQNRRVDLGYPSR